MTISEVIKELQRLRREHGDVTLGICTDGDEEFEITKVSTLRAGAYKAAVMTDIGSYCRTCRRGCD